MVCCTIGLVCGWVTRSDGIWEQKKTYELSERKVSKQDILKLPTAHSIKAHVTSEFMGKTFQAAQLTTKYYNVTYSTTHQRSVEVQFGSYQKKILQE